jgi:hypothetical protein
LISKRRLADAPGSGWNRSAHPSNPQMLEKPIAKNGNSLLKKIWPPEAIGDGVHY